MTRLQVAGGRSRRAPVTGPGLLVCAPLRLEARALRRGLRSAGQETGQPTGQETGQPTGQGTGQPTGAGRGAVRVVATGYGPRRASARETMLRDQPFAAMAIAGVGGGLAADLRPGDLVVASEVTDGHTVIPCPSAALLAGELRRAGLRVRVGRVVTVDHLVRGAERERLAATGALVADMESAVLARAVAGRPLAVVRAVSDTPDRPLVSPGVLGGGLAALRSLRAAGPALARWAAAVAERQVLLAGPRSFCAGVERAIEIVERALDQKGPPVYVRKQIVHNSHVVAGLEERGAIFVDELSEVPDGASVVFSAHGVSPAVRDEADRRRLTTVDATCPLVAKVHAEARRFASDGYLVALIGHEGHEEVEGTLGEAPDSVALVQTATDVGALQPPDPGKVAYLMQTTLAADEAADIAEALRERFPAARAPGSDDICYATTNRQRAARAVAAEADLVLVAGSANSSNSVRLVETAQRAGTTAYLIDGPSDIELSWLAGVSAIGLTAGASAPPAVVQDIINALRGLGTVEVSERVITTENIRFSLPKEVRQS
ncbi:MAG TPA: 4-hydroxy-3-methylbut-2-enyl diphosphate reductase [Streptosporangiaceae bacterium]|nr:4-hydroxy-3-methylbut-2-enyl diphosphate reductase [Streptosporangiaceae bacterium]